MKPSLRAAVLIACSLAGGILPVRAQTASTEYQLKAAFLFNFTRFIEWPPGSPARSAGAYTFCLVGDPFGGALDAIVRGERIEDRPIRIERRAPNADLAGCRVVFVSVGEASRAPDIVRRAALAGALTVGEDPDFIRNGGMIRFFQEGGRVRFEINLAAAERAGLSISSRLLRLAVVVRSE